MSVVPRIEVAISPQFDMCYGLADLVSPSPGWALFDKRVRGAEWFREARKFGWAFWLALPDILGAREPVATVGELIDALTAVPGEVARNRLVEGLFHDVKEGSPNAARKREWLAFVGLDGDAGADATRTVLRKEGAAIIAAAVEVLERFRPDFEPRWEQHAAALSGSARRVAKLAAKAEFPTVADKLKLKIEVDTDTQRMRALRGGYEVDLRDLDMIYLLPSLVNSKGFWTVPATIRPRAAFFPYVDPDQPPITISEAPVDPWLVCRAMGDPTRAAIVRRLNARSMTSAELMRELSLSKANISHHIFQLREAGLIREADSEGRAVRLSLNRATLNQLSAAFRLALPAKAGPKKRKDQG